MREFRIAVLPGDGIGREVMAPCLSLLETVVARIGGFRLNLESYEAGAEVYRNTGIALPADAISAAATADAILLGAMGLPGVRYPNGTEITPQIELRERFQL
jgi:3-isopropylmalate dehydrogenase